MSIKSYKWYLSNDIILVINILIIVNNNKWNQYLN